MQNRLLTLIFVLICLCRNSGQCSEVYAINEKPVLMYKVIQWWYNSLPQEDHLLCSSPVKWQSKGSLQIRYNESKKELVLQLEKPSLLFLAESGGLPYTVTCTQLSKTWFPQGDAANPEAATDPESIVFHNISNSQALTIKTMAQEMRVEIQGRIKGLVNGRIALVRPQEPIKACPPDPPISEAGIYLTITHSGTDEIIAAFIIK